MTIFKRSFASLIFIISCGLITPQAYGAQAIALPTIIPQVIALTATAAKLLLPAAPAVIATTTAVAPAVVATTAIATPTAIATGMALVAKTGISIGAAPALALVAKAAVVAKTAAVAAPTVAVVAETVAVAVPAVATVAKTAVVVKVAAATGAVIAAPIAPLVAMGTVTVGGIAYSVDKITEGAVSDAANAAWGWIVDRVCDEEEVVEEVIDGVKKVYLRNRKAHREAQKKERKKERKKEQPPQKPPQRPPSPKPPKRGSGRVFAGLATKTFDEFKKYIQSILDEAIKRLPNISGTKVDNILHALRRHIPGGSEFLFKPGRTSLFNPVSDKDVPKFVESMLKECVDIIKTTSGEMQRNGTLKYIKDMGRIIGIDKYGNPTSLLQVVYSMKEKAIKTFYPVGKKLLRSRL